MGVLQQEHTLFFVRITQNKIEQIIDEFMLLGRDFFCKLCRLYLETMIDNAERRLYSK